MVDVVMMTYNHEKYIKKAIEGVIMQETEFEIRLIIADDASTDGTAKIVAGISGSGTTKILHSRNKENIGAQANFLSAMQSCSSKYVALCEGDDYWIDKYKLQKQVDFLEANPDFAICYHRVYELYPGKPLQLETVNTESIEKEYTILDLAKGGFTSTPTVVFRNHLFKEFPDWFNKSPVGDYVLHMLNARHGKIKYLPEPMAVYRRHGKGIWGLKKTEYQLTQFNIVLDLLIIEFESDRRVKEILKKQKALNLSNLGKTMLYERNVDKAKNYFDEAFLLDNSLKEEWVRTHYPEFIKNLYNSKRFKAINKILSIIGK